MAPYLATLILAASTGYIYPLPSWHVTTQHGEAIGGGLYHMGVDAGFDSPAGTPVYAAGPGIVREAQERSQFGLVVLIEHEAGTDSAHVSLYGHLDPTAGQVTVGQEVNTGDIIGVLGDSSVNGGWSVHLHFGIHKAPYTGDWVYYGHVYDPETAKDWYNPEKYIPNHLASDIWQPSLHTDLTDGMIIGNTLPLTATVGDIGSGVQTLKLKLKTPTTNWVTVGTYTEPYYDFSDEVDISSYPDGDITFKLVARDGITEKTTLSRTLVKDEYRYTTPAFFAAKGGESDNFVTQWSFGGTALNAFFPFGEEWTAGGYLAATNDVVAVVRRDTKDSTSVVKLFSPSGTLQTKFKLPHIQPAAIWLTDDQVIIADQRAGTLVGYTTTGEVQWTITPTLTTTDIALIDNTLYVCGYVSDTALIQVFDTAGILLEQFRPLSKYLPTPGCHLAVGDVTGDGATDIVVSSNGQVAGTVAVLSTTGERIIPSFRPFGDEFIGQIDVAILQWDTTEDSISEQEVLISQASRGQAWVKTYQLSATPVILLEKRVYEESFTNGTQVVSSVYAE